MKEKMKATFEWVLIFVMAVGIGYYASSPGVMNCDVVVEEEQDYTPDWLKEDPSRIGLGPRRNLEGIDIYLDEFDNEIKTVVRCDDGSKIYMKDGIFITEVGPEEEEKE